MSGFKTKALFFGSMAKGGHMQMRELVDYPGVQIMDCKEDYKSDWKRTVAYGANEYKTISEAVDAWKKDNGEGQIT